MDPCTAVVISKMEEDLDIFGLVDFSNDLISEILDELKAANNMDYVVELHKDIFDIRSIIEKTYEKKYGKRLDWKANTSL